MGNVANGRAGPYSFRNELCLCCVSIGQSPVKQSASQRKVPSGLVAAAALLASKSVIGRIGKQNRFGFSER
jgi:hypothetical protein